MYSFPASKGYPINSAIEIEEIIGWKSVTLLFLVMTAFRLTNIAMNVNGAIEPFGSSDFMPMSKTVTFRKFYCEKK